MVTKSRSTRLIQHLPGMTATRPLWATPQGQPLLDDYLAAEAWFREWTERNVNRLCAICAHWTAFVAEAASGAETMTWGLSAWVTSCCNANHACESMTPDRLAGVAATATHGQDWVQQVQRAPNAPCEALTETGCALTAGRPELCNRYCCEGVRDYFWLLGGEALAARLDEVQKMWTHLYSRYGAALLAPAKPPPEARSHVGFWKWRRPSPLPHDQRERLRQEARWYEFKQHLAEFDDAIAACVRDITVDELAHRLFKVSGDETGWRPFLTAQLGAIRGRIRRPDHHVTA